MEWRWLCEVVHSWSMIDLRRRGVVAWRARHPASLRVPPRSPPRCQFPLPPPLAVRPDCQEPSGGAIHDGYGPRTLREREIRREMQ